MFDFATLPGPARVAARALAVALLGGLVAGCGNTLDRLSRVGEAPEQSKIENPAKLHGSQPIQVPMPRPLPQSDVRHVNSLWSPGSRAFFKDQRANEVGDILSVVININDSAELENQSSRNRDAAENAGLGGFFGFEGQLEGILPDEVDPTSLVDADSTSEHTGSGQIEREEQINMRVATMVTQVLPNGNLVVAGRQEVRVNYENRVLQITGIVRPEDITSTNEISHEDIAEARISYGGQGQLSDVQQPRYGQQIYDIIFPF